VAAVHFDLTTQTPRCAEWSLPGEPWLITGSPGNRYGFTCSKAGELHWFDWTAEQHPLHRLGVRSSGHDSLLECSDDGALVLLHGSLTTLWDRAAAQPLWTREGTQIASCAFWPGSHRLLCGLETGELVELDPQTGLTLRPICRLQWPLKLSIAPDGQSAVCSDKHGRCTVVELATGSCTWSHKSRSLSLARFAPDGRRLFVTNPEWGVDLAIYSLDSGQRLAAIGGTDEHVKDVQVSPEGVAYFYYCDSRLIAWDPARRSITCWFAAPGTQRFRSPRPL